MSPEVGVFSSRSRFVFTWRIFGVNESTEQQVQGVLNLIDLAGSERLSTSGSTGDRLRETQAINKSLSSLSEIIFAVAKKLDHVMCHLETQSLLIFCSSKESPSNPTSPRTKERLSLLSFTDCKA